MFALGSAQEDALQAQSLDTLESLSGVLEAALPKMRNAIVEKRVQVNVKPLILSVMVCTWIVHNTGYQYAAFQLGATGMSIYKNSLQNLLWQ